VHEPWLTEDEKTMAGNLTGIGLGCISLAAAGVIVACLVLHAVGWV